MPQLPEWDGAAELPQQPTHTFQALQGAMRLEDVPLHRDPTCSAASPSSDANLPFPCSHHGTGRACHENSHWTLTTVDLAR